MATHHYFPVPEEEATRSKANCIPGMIPSTMGRADVDAVSENTRMTDRYFGTEGNIFGTQTGPTVEDVLR